MGLRVTLATLRERRIGLAAMAVVFSVLGGAFGEGVVRAQNQLPTPADLSRAFIEVAKKVKPAVVHIEVETRARRTSQRGLEGLPQIPGFPPLEELQPRRQRGTGSGVIISPDGHILTNNHVVGEADVIKVKLGDGRELIATRVGTDPETDLAVIRVDAGNLPHAVLGDSDRVEQGEWVLALGSPFGLQQTMTAGIVSATGRDLPIASPFTNFIQTDASINPGNSGGALVNMNGEVIGINTLIFSRTGMGEGIGFAIPSNLTSKIYAQLVESGKVTRGYLGVYLGDVTPALARNAGFSGSGGAVVRDVTGPDSPAAKAGLRSGDLITELDGKSVKSTRHLMELVADSPVGKRANVRYFRDGQAGTTAITLGERPRLESARAEDADATQGTGLLGVTVETVTPRHVQELGLKISSGALVQRVQPGSPAFEAGMRTGDVIHRVNRTEVGGAQDLTRALESLKGAKEMVLQISRRGQLDLVTVTLE